MTNNKIYEFIGKITSKEKEKVYNKKSPYYGNIYYRLAVELENNSELNEILVFQNGKVWKDIKEANYIGKRYLFYCSSLVSNYRIVSYQLVDWKKLASYEEK